MPSSRYNKYKKISHQLGADSVFCRILATAGGQSERDLVADTLRSKLGVHEPFLANETLYRDFLTYCHRNIDGLPSPDLAAAVLANAQFSKSLWSQRNLYIFALGLNWKAKGQSRRRDDALTSLPKLAVKWLAHPYPPPNSLVADTPATANLWRAKVTSGKQPDKRRRRPNLLILDEKLVTTLARDESAILVNSISHHICGVVWRNFVREPSVLDDLVAVGKESAETRRSIRKEDSGSIQVAGYTPGSRSSPQFDWCKNLRSKKHSDEAVSEMNYRISSAFAFAWNLFRAWLPPEIIGDFDNFMVETDMLAMDGNRCLPTINGDYEATINGLTMKFDNVRLAPPQGVMAVNYSRAIHREVQPHQWAISLNTLREGSSGEGGSFYFAQYGVRVLQATNTLIAFKPSDAHGSSLLHRHPADDAWYSGNYQMGLAIASSPRLVSTFIAYKKNQLKKEEVLDQLQSQQWPRWEIRYDKAYRVHQQTTAHVHR